MAVRILVFAMDTRLDALEPLVLHNLLDRDTGLGVGVQYPLHELAASHGEFLKGLVVVDLTHRQEVLVVGVLCGRGAEGNTLVDHAVVDNTTGPDINTAGIVLLGLEFLGGNIGFGAAETLGQVGLCLPAHAEDIRDSKVGNLEVTLVVEQQVLRLDVSVCDTHRVQVSNAVHQLLEAAINLGSRHMSLLDCVVQVSTRAVLLQCLEREEA